MAYSNGGSKTRYYPYLPWPDPSLFRLRRYAVSWYNAHSVEYFWTFKRALRRYIKRKPHAALYVWKDGTWRESIVSANRNR